MTWVTELGKIAPIAPHRDTPRPSDTGPALIEAEAGLGQKAAAVAMGEQASHYHRHGTLKSERMREVNTEGFVGPQ